MKSWIAILTLTFGSVVFAQQTQPPPAPAPTKPRLTLTTDAFEDGGIIPNKFTMAAEGTPVSPKLTWTFVPDGTVSFALILHDPDTSLMKKTEWKLASWPCICSRFAHLQLYYSTLSRPSDISLPVRCCVGPLWDWPSVRLSSPL